MADKDTLKGFFKKGEIPTEEHFAELIDSSYNVEDGVNGPLKIGGAGQSSTDKSLINFYTNAVDPDDPQWAIKLADYSQEGFSINENNDQPRLFIKKGSGEVGVGTTNPRMSLQVDTPSLHGAPAIGGYRTGSNNHNGWLYMHVVSNNGAEHAIIWDDKRPLRFGVETNMGDGATFRNLLTISPEANRGTGIYFPNNTAGGSGDNAWIKYYAKVENGKVTDKTVLEIGIGNDGLDADGLTADNTDNIILRSSGNVGIGVDDPQSKLHVAGNMRVSGLLSCMTLDSRALSTLNGVVNINSPVSIDSYLNIHVPQNANKDILAITTNRKIRVDAIIMPNADYTEYFESIGQHIIPLGTSVILDEQGLIKAAQKDEVPIGVISSTPSITCNDFNEWPQKHLKNEFGQTLTEEIEEDIITTEGKTERKKVQKPILNPAYDPTREYIPRDQRPEWHPVGLLGQLHLRKGQPVAPTWVKIKDISENVELWLVK